MIVLIRHGSTDANRDGRFLSRADLPLNQEGREQARRLASHLKGLDIGQCFTSPMRRCIETAHIALPHAQLIVRPELAEVDYGEWELLRADEIAGCFPGLLERRRDAPATFRPPGGESFADAARRLRPLFQTLVRDAGAVIAHRGTLGVLERLLRALEIGDPSIVPMETGEMRFVF
jgi:broad specificity phosphatase PhoE